ncbi:hypothetical protein EV191_105318 [Tamaricihabitans halophyticus]|uniref:WXG100 family type VII secretion target n=1 Tax=Tamaricihabitans halophyticus TaxID=1262583 RepID=A0A4R2R1C7_9PSEU|nr:hypothetical protein [Tamaricihabitans halophyticus]TCP53251.1 hypothetical protein EV191_105318 [Tamaricihabitans halophyticus]
MMFENSFQRSIAKNQDAISDEQAKEMRKLLNDPNVSDEDKQNMLYGLATVEKIPQDEMWKHAEKLGVDYFDLYRGGEAPLENVANAAASLESGKSAQRQGAVKDSQGRLAEGGFNNSNEIIDESKAGLKIFDDFHPRYLKATENGGAAPQGKAGANGGGGIDPDSLRKVLDELRDIDFKAFRADADQVEQAATGVGESHNVLTQAWANNLSGWQGEAAGAASQYKSKFDAAASTLDTGMRKVPGAITEAAGTVEQQVVDLVNGILEQYGDGTMGGMATAQVDAALKIRDEAGGIISGLDQVIEKLNDRSLVEKAFDFVTDVLGKVFPIVGILGKIQEAIVNFGLDVITNITESTVGPFREQVQGALDSANESLRKFVQDYEQRAGNVKESASTATQNIQQTYETLQRTATEGLKENPFDKLETAPAFEDGGQSGQQGSGNNGQTGTAGSDSTGQPAGGEPNAGKPGGGQPSGGDPSTGMKPEDAAKQAGLDPEAGQPVGGTDPTGEQPTAGGKESVSIKDGDRTITMESAGGSPKMTLTIDDGSGEPKTYEMDFSKALGMDEGEAAAGAGDPAGEQPGQGEPGQGQPGQGQPGQSQPEAGDAGAPGPPSDSAQDLGEVIAGQVGEDGKVHIEDGPMTITGEMTDEGLKVTIDDGEGEPQTYTVDTEGSATAGQPGTAEAAAPVAGTPAGGGAEAAASAPAAGGGQAPSGGAAMPAASASATSGAGPGGESAGSGDGNVSGQTTTPQAVGAQHGTGAPAGMSGAGVGQAPGAGAGEPGQQGMMPAGTGGGQHQPTGAGVGGEATTPRSAPEQGGPGVAEASQGQQASGAVGGAYGFADTEQESGPWRSVAEALGAQEPPAEQRTQ